MEGSQVFFNAIDVNKCLIFHSSSYIRCQSVLKTVILVPYKNIYRRNASASGARNRASVDHDSKQILRRYRFVMPAADDADCRARTHFVYLSTLVPHNGFGDNGAPTAVTVLPIFLICILLPSMHVYSTPTCLFEQYHAVRED